MRKYKKWIAIFLAIMTVLVYMPVNSAKAADDLTTVNYSIVWHGGDPTNIFMLLECKFSGLYETVFAINWVHATEYLGNGEWKDSGIAYYDASDYDPGVPFIAVKRDYLDGLWYCDKWDWNNVIYQPGEYGQNYNAQAKTYDFSFLLTSSAPTNNSVTVNRTWANGAPAVDTTVNLFRHYNIENVCNSYELIKSTTLSKDQNSVTFGGLYGGNYVVSQTVPTYYDDDSTDTFDNVSGTGKAAVLSSGTSASVSFTDTYSPPPFLTINRYFTGNSPAVDTTFDIYSMNDSSLKKTVTIPAGQGNTQISDLSAGTYAIIQRLPNHYGDEITSGTAYSGSLGNGAQVTLSSGTNPAVSFADCYYPPPKYNVDIAALSGGTIISSLSQAAEGDTVSLTVTPNTDMQLKSGTLKYADSTGDHAISGMSFTMPNEEVSVSAQFEARQYNISVAALAGGAISPDKTMAAYGDTVNLTITPDAGKKLKDNTLKYTYSSYTIPVTETSVPITGTSFTMPKTDVTVSGTFETPVSITNASLPEGMQGVPYSATLAAQDGTAGYTWSAENLPDGLALNAATGVISGTPAGHGKTDVKFTVTDGNGETVSKTLSLYLNAICGNGGYLITPDADAAYTAGATTGGLPTMTVNSGTSGFKYFSVKITNEKGHAGSEVLLFTQTRGGQQIAMAANYADYDSITSGKAAFNVRPGDVITACIVDALSNDASVNPTIL
jgi:hypothetical protein